MNPAQRRLALGAAAATGALVLGEAVVSPAKLIVGLVGLSAAVGFFLALRWYPALGGVLVVGGLALQPALKFFVSSYFGPAKDALVIFIVLAFVSRYRRSHSSLLRRDVVLAVFVAIMIAFYLANPAGTHNSAWGDETRLVVESLLLFAVALAEPDGRKVARTVMTTLVAVGVGEAVLGAFQQLVGYQWLIVHLGYVFGGQVRLSSSGHLRSFGTFDDAFSFGSFELIATVVSMRWRNSGRRGMRYLIPAILCFGVIESYVRTDWVILAVLGVVAVGRLVRRSAWPPFLAGAGLIVIALLVSLSSSHVTNGGTYSGQSFLLSLNGRTAVWSQIIPTPSVLIAGDGVGRFGEGLARSQQSGIQSESHYKAGQAPAPVAAVGALTSIDSSYLAIMADIGIPGLLLLLGILYRLATLYRRAQRLGDTDGWVALGVLFVIALDGVTRSSLTAFPSGYIELYLLGCLAAGVLPSGRFGQGLRRQWAGRQGRRRQGSGRQGSRRQGPGRPLVTSPPHSSSDAAAVREVAAGPSPSPAPAARVGRFSARSGASSAVGSRLVGKTFGLVLVLILAHNSSTARFAQYSYLLILAATLSTLTDLGVAAVAAREVARGDTPLASAYRAALPAQLCTNLVASVVVVVFGSLAPGPGVSLPALAAVAAFSFVNGLFDLQCELLRGSGRPLTEASLQVVNAVLQTGLCSAAILTGGSLAEVMGAMALSSVITLVVAQAYLPLPKAGATHTVLQRSLFFSGLWLGASTTCMAVMARSAVLILANVGSTLQVANLAVASRFQEFGTTVCYTLGIGLLPSLARRAAHAPDLFRHHARRLLSLGFVAAVALVAPLVLVVPSVVTALFGEKFHMASGTAQLFVAAVPISLVLNVSWFLLVAQRRERWVIAGAGSGLIATLVGSATILALHHTATAAAQATIGGAMVCAIVLGGLAVKGRTVAVRPPSRALVGV